MREAYHIARPSNGPHMLIEEQMSWGRICSGNNYEMITEIVGGQGVKDVDGYEVSKRGFLLFQGVFVGAFMIEAYQMMFVSFLSAFWPIDTISSH